jgi:hypothetical protein
LLSRLRRINPKPTEAMGQLWQAASPHRQPGIRGSCLVAFRVTGVPDEDSCTVAMDSHLHSNPINHNELKNADRTIPPAHPPDGDEP